MWLKLLLSEFDQKLIELEKTRVPSTSGNNFKVHHRKFRVERNIHSSLKLGDRWTLQAGHG
jgi:hypothetical protein